MPIDMSVLPQEWGVVGEDGEQVAEVLDGQEDAEQLLIKHRLVLLSQGQLSQPEFQGPPGVVGHLLKDSADPNIAGVCGEAEGSRVDGKGERTWRA